VIGQELLKTKVGKRMVQKGSNDVQRARCHVGAKLRALKQMHCVSDGRRKNLRSVAIVTVNQDDLFDKIESIC